MTGPLTLERRAELLGGNWKQAAKFNWLCDDLVATDLAYGRVRAWAEAGRLDTPALDADQINERLAFVGDRQIRETVVDVLSVVPPPVVDFCVDHVLFLATGVSTRGWVMTAPTDKVPVWVVLSEADAGIIAHELAHVHLHIADGVPASNRTSARERYERDNALLALANTVDSVHVERTIIEPDCRRERQAAALARRWGFRGEGADGNRCARAAERDCWRQIRGLAETTGGTGVPLGSSGAPLERVNGTAESG